MSEAAWNKAFTQGSKAMQDRLRKVHAKNPKFQSWLQKSGHGAGSSVKQASKEVKPSARVKKLQQKSLKAYGATKGLRMGGEDGSGETVRDTVAPLTRDQHSKVQAAQRAAKAAAKKAGPKKPLTKSQRLAAIAAAARKAKAKHDVPTIDPDDDHDDLRDVHQSLHIRRGYNEEMKLEEGKMKDIVTDREETARLAAQEKEPPFTPDKNPVRRGRGGPMSQAKWLAKQAMMKKMKKEEVELVEQDDTMEKKEMAQTQLHFMQYAAKEILEFIAMGGEIEEWYQNKLSKVHSDVEGLHSYVEGEKRRIGLVGEEKEEVEQIDEAKVDPAKQAARQYASSHKDLKVTTLRNDSKENGHEGKHIHFVHHKDSDIEFDGDPAVGFSHHEGKINVHADDGGFTGRNIKPKKFDNVEHAVKHAHGIMPTNEEVEPITEKYMGFKAVMAAAKKGGARDPAAVAAAIGRKKYGKEKFQAAAAAGKKMSEALDPVGKEDKDIDNDGDSD
ncbi:MAG: hypothetical protein ACO3LE_10205, partial [Bdellovibrionota bacterium]